MVKTYQETQPKTKAKKKKSGYNNHQTRGLENPLAFTKAIISSFVHLKVQTF
jgi:hypothetical protein